MAHYQFSDSNSVGSRLRRSLTNIEDGVLDLARSLGAMSQMITGDGSQDAHYQLIADRYSFATAATARAAFNELQSLYGKFNTDDAVTFSKAAREQAMNQFR